MLELKFHFMPVEVHMLPGIVGALLGLKVFDGLCRQLPKCDAEVEMILEFMRSPVAPSALPSAVEDLADILWTHAQGRAMSNIRVGFAKVLPLTRQDLQGKSLMSGNSRPEMQLPLHYASYTVRKMFSGVLAVLWGNP